LEGGRSWVPGTRDDSSISALSNTPPVDIAPSRRTRSHGASRPFGYLPPVLEERCEARVATA
jgi:hypothetical protein